MASLDMLLLGKLIHTGKLGDLLAAGFVPEDLSTKEGLRLWGLVENHSNSAITYGQVPSFDYLASHIPGLELPSADDSSFESLVQAAKNFRIMKSARNAVKEILPRLGDTYDASGLTVIGALRDHLEDLIRQGSANTDTTLAKGFATVVANYEAKKSGDISFLPWPWPELRQYSPGIAPTDFVVFYGRPKNKKTFVVLFTIVRMFLQGKRVLIYSKEMPAEEIWERIICFIADLPFDGLYNVRLSEEDYERMYQAEDFIRRTKEEHPGADIICVSGLDAPQGSDSVSWFASKVRHYRPDLAVVDGMYLMAGDGKVKEDHVRVMNISRALRNMALRFKIPVLATIQANRNADKTGKDPMADDTNMGEVAYSDAVGQDATALFRIVANRINPTANIIVTGGRNLRLRGFEIWAIPCTNFRWIRALDEESAQSSILNDKGEDVLDQPPTPAKGRGKKKQKPVSDVLNERVDDLLE